MKFLGLCLFGLIMLFGVTACRRNEVELSFAWWGDDTRTVQTNHVLSLFIDYHRDVTAVRRFPRTYSSHISHLLDLHVLDLPDIMQLDFDMLMEFTASGMLLDLSQYISDGRIDVSNLPTTAVNEGMIGTGIFGIPISMDSAVLAYNETLINELGLNVPSNMNLEQFMNIGREVYERRGIRTNWAFGDPLVQLEVHLRARGARLFNDNRLGGINDDYAEFFRVIATGITEGWHVRPEHIEGRFGWAQNPMWYPLANPNMRTWNSPIWSSIAADYVNMAPGGISIALTEYPTNNAPAAGLSRGVIFLGISAASLHTSEAADFINFWINSLEVYEIVLYERGAIINSGIRNEISRDLLDPAARLQSDFINGLGDYIYFRGASPQNINEIRTLLLEYINDVVIGILTPEQAAVGFINSANNILD